MDRCAPAGVWGASRKGHVPEYRIAPLLGGPQHPYATPRPPSNAKSQHNGSSRLMVRVGCRSDRVRGLLMGSGPSGGWYYRTADQSRGPIRTS